VEGGVGEQARVADVVVVEVGQDDGLDSLRVDTVPGEFERKGWSGSPGR